MKTRRQLKEEAEKKTSRSKSIKLTKAELLRRRQENNKAKKGKSVGAKKQKIQVSAQIIKKGAKAAKGKKQQKQVRIKPSLQKITRSASKSSLKVQVKIGKSKQVKTKNPKNKSVGGKTQKKSPQPIQLPRKKASQLKKDQKKEPEKQIVKTIIMKGKIPIDDYFPLNKADYHVLEHQGKIYSATLNQTNVLNNNNKFYMLQILQSDSNSNNCYFFTRWGRVGVAGQNSNLGPMSVVSSVLLYNSKHTEKSRKGDYRQIQLNYGDQQEEKKVDDKKQKEDKKDDNNNNANTVKKESTLPQPVQKLIELIFDINMMNRQMVQIGYNVNKMPLGKLSKENIKRGYGILKQLYDQIKGHKRHSQIVRLTNDFYSYIPHDFGFQNMSLHILDTQPKVKAKIEMLEALAQIKVATTLLSQKSEDSNKIDSNYSKLNRKLEPVDRSSTQFSVINDYLHTTHGKHHTSYSLEIVDLFRLENQMESVRYTKDIHNKMLLWHGSRLTNFVGILSQGLRIAPPEAPVTGYMFGKGVYFADMSSKSANYCFTSRQNNTGILLLCEVALGNMNQKTHADYYAANLPPNKHSTKGIGKIQPDPKNAKQLQKGVTIPIGPGIQSFDPNLYLRYNQFIVYDIAQIKIKYLLRTKFSYI